MSHEATRLQDLPFDVLGSTFELVDIDESLAAHYGSKHALLRCVSRHMQQAVDATAERLFVQQDLDSEELTSILQRFKGCCTAIHDQRCSVSACVTWKDSTHLMPARLSLLRCMQLTWCCIRCRFARYPAA